MRVCYQNDSIKLAVIGDPVANSLSPLLQNTMIDCLGLNYMYFAQRIPPYQLSDWVSASTMLELGGFNATMPHKRSLLPFMETLSEDARLFGAVNTVVIRKRECRGYNTDGDGFLRSLAGKDVLPQGLRVVVIGSGAAARSITLKLARSGVEELNVCCRNQSQGEAIKKLNPANIAIRQLDEKEMPKILKRCDLLINCTPIGMHGNLDRFADLSMLDDLPDNAVVYDTVYNPAQTALLAAATARGHQTINGLDMLIHQGILSLELFADIRIEPASVMQPVRQALMDALRCQSDSEGTGSSLTTHLTGAPNSSIL